MALIMVTSLISAVLSGGNNGIAATYAARACAVLLKPIFKENERRNGGSDRASDFGQGLIDTKCQSQDLDPTTMLLPP